MDNYITCHSVVRLDSALANLAEHPERLEESRARFSQSPEPSPQDLAVSAECHSYDSPSEEQQLLEERYFKIVEERSASQPYDQLGYQALKEQEIVYRSVVDKTLRMPPGTSFYALAKENVKARWVEQGIWNDKWNDMAFGRWKHEELPDTPSEPALKPTDPTTRLFLEERIKMRRMRKINKTKIGLNHPPTKEWRERQASRPYHQFMYQISFEREKIQHELMVGEESIYLPEDINTRAYNRVKDDWTERGIWDTKWSTLPGMSWKHERPIKDFLDDDLIAYAAERPYLDERRSFKPGNPAKSRRRVHFELDEPEQDTEMTGSGGTRGYTSPPPMRSPNADYNSGISSPVNEEEDKKPISEASEGEDYSHRSKPKRRGQRKPVKRLKNKRPKSKTYMPKSSGKAIGIVKTWREKKRKETLERNLKEIL